MEQLPGRMKPAWRIVWGAVCYVLAYISCTTYSLNPPYATLWLCSGVTLFVLLRLPRRKWWIALLVNAVFDFLLELYFNHFPLKFAILGTFSNTADPLLAGLLVMHLVGSHIEISRLKHVILLFGSIWIATILTALSGAYAIWLMSDGIDYWINVFRWTLSGGLGSMLVLWTMLAWTTPQCAIKHKWWELAERGLALTINLVLIQTLYLTNSFSDFPGIHLSQLRIPVVIWVLIRFGHYDLFLRYVIPSG